MNVYVFAEYTAKTYTVEYKQLKSNKYYDSYYGVANVGTVVTKTYTFNSQIVVENIELPIDEIKVKRKEKFDGEVFAISKGKEDYGTDLIAELYIPAEMLDIQFVENVIKYNSNVYAIYKGANEIRIEKYIKSIDGELKEIEKQYEEVYKACDRYNLGYHTKDIIENLDKLKALAEQYVEAKKRVESLTIDDIDL